MARVSSPLPLPLAPFTTGTATALMATPEVSGWVVFSGLAGVGAAPLAPAYDVRPAPAAALAREHLPMPMPSSGGPLRPLQDQVTELELAAIAAALQATQGNRAAAAKLLKMSRAAFYDRLDRHPALAALGR